MMSSPTQSWAVTPFGQGFCVNLQWLATTCARSGQALAWKLAENFLRLIIESIVSLGLQDCITMSFWKLCAWPNLQWLSTCDSVWTVLFVFQFNHSTLFGLSIVKVFILNCFNMNKHWSASVFWEWRKAMQLCICTRSKKDCLMFYSHYGYWKMCRLWMLCHNQKHNPTSLSRNVPGVLPLVLVVLFYQVLPEKISIKIKYEKKERKRPKNF